MTVHRNAAECVKCGKIIESITRHEYRTHSCDSSIWFMVDGGLAYVRRGWKGGTTPGDNYIDRSVENDEPHTEYERAAATFGRWPY